MTPASVTESQADEKSEDMDWHVAQLVRHLLSIYEALSSMPRIHNKQNQRTEGRTTVLRKCPTDAQRVLTQPFYASSISEGVLCLTKIAVRMPHRF